MTHCRVGENVQRVERFLFVEDDIQWVEIISYRFRSWSKGRRPRAESVWRHVASKIIDVPQGLGEKLVPDPHHKHFLYCGVHVAAEEKA